MKLIIHWVLSALAIIITAYLLPGIAVKGAFVALVVAVVLGFFNMIVKPILLVLTLPINVMTLGIFTFVINAGMVMAVSAIVPGFHVASFGWALLFSLVLWAVNAVLHLFEPEGK